MHGYAIIKCILNHTMKWLVTVMSKQPVPITITTYNTHKGMSALNRHVQVIDIAQALKNLTTDILFLQEVQGHNLKRAVKYNDYPDESQHDFFGEYLAFNRTYGKNAEFPSRHHGNAVLSRFPLDPKHNVNITVNKLEQRGVLHCEIHPTHWDKPLVALCAHLNLRHADRVKQYQAIQEYVCNSIDPSFPLILAGDFNDWSHKSCEGLGNTLGMQEVFMTSLGKLPRSFPARLPVLSLDRIYIRNLEIISAHVHTGEPWSKLSDHLPLSATLQLKNEC